MCWVYTVYWETGSGVGLTLSVVLGCGRGMWWVHNVLSYRTVVCWVHTVTGCRQLGVHTVLECRCVGWVCTAYWHAHMVCVGVHTVLGSRRMLGVHCVLGDSRDVCYLHTVLG